MLKGIAEAQIKLASDKTSSLNETLEYWRGVKNTAELFLNEILEQEQQDLEEFESALEEAPMDLSMAGGPVTGNI